jgi:hypothetical protein
MMDIVQNNGHIYFEGLVLIIIAGYVHHLQLSRFYDSL